MSRDVCLPEITLIEHLWLVGLWEAEGSFIAGPPSLPRSLSSSLRLFEQGVRAGGDRLVTQPISSPSTRYQR